MADRDTTAYRLRLSNAIDRRKRATKWQYNRYGPARFTLATRPVLVGEIAV